MAAVTALVLPSVASATTAPLSIAVTTSTSVTNGSTTTYVANVGVTYSITYTIKANTSGATFTNVGFTDTLPAGVSLDDEVGETAKNCGTPFTPSNQPGQTTVTETGLTVLNSSAAGWVGSCAVTLDFVASTPEVGASDSITGATYTTDSTTYTQADDPSDFAITPVALTVAAQPTITISGVTNNATYAPGQNVVLNYTATAAANDSIAPGDVQATDDQGNTLADGQAVNTLVPGAHQVQVWVDTADGYVGSETVGYNVSSPSLTAVKTTKTGSVSFGVKFLAAGSILAKVLDGKTIVGTLTKTVKAGKNATFTIKPTAAGKRLLAKNKKKGIKVKLTVLYTATNWNYIAGQPVITRTGITLK